MQYIRYGCRILTPMMLHGANARKAALRSSAFKSSMRFWWRALIDLDQIELLTLETSLFGGVGSVNGIQGARSPFNIQVYEEDGLQEADNILLLPHKNKNARTGGFKPDNKPSNISFTVVISIRETDCAIPVTDKLNFYGKLFELASVLGGVGNRSRRGAGSYCIVSKDSNNPEISDDCKVENLIDWLKETMTYVATYGAHGKELSISIRTTGRSGVDTSLNLARNWNSMVKLRRTIVYQMKNPVAGNILYEKLLTASHEIRDVSNPIYVSFTNPDEKKRAADTALGTVSHGRLASPFVVTSYYTGGFQYLIISYLTFKTNGLKLNDLKRIQKKFEDIIISKF